MTHKTDHIDDELLSALVDDQLTPEEKALVQRHLASCSACLARLEELRSVVALLRELPELQPPRDFTLGPRLLVDPPNMIRLRRVYTAVRTAAASLAAVFVLLSAGALYVDTRPGSVPVTELAQPRTDIAPAAPAAKSAPAAADSQAATPAVRSAAPAAANQSGPAPASQPAPAVGAAAAARPATVASPQPDDQVAAATSVSPLPPTPVPTPQPTAILPRVLSPITSNQADSAAPLRYGAILVGLLAVLSLLAALIVRHRLRRAAPQV